MNKELLISIKPEYLVNILNGKKTLELRKSVPKNYKGWVNIYCTKSSKHILYKYKDIYYTHHYLTFTDSVEVLNGKVVARFWFDDYIAYKYYEDDNTYFSKRPQDFGYNADEVLKRLCLSRDEFKAYGKGKDLYAWHIKNLEIFETPKKLSDFYKTNIPYTGIIEIEYALEKYGIEKVDKLLKYTIQKPPKTYTYVYTKENEK